MAPSDPAPSDDEPIVSDALSDPVRRHVLVVLSDTDVPMALADLARAVARREASGSDEAVDAERAKRIRTSLHHVHVPKLEAAGMVEYDAERRTATANVSVDPPDGASGREDWDVRADPRPLDAR